MLLIRSSFACGPLCCRQVLEQMGYNETTGRGTFAVSTFLMQHVFRYRPIRLSYFPEAEDLYNITGPGGRALPVFNFDGL